MIFFGNSHLNQRQQEEMWAYNPTEDEVRRAREILERCSMEEVSDQDALYAACIIKASGKDAYFVTPLWLMAETLLFQEKKMSSSLMLFLK